MADLNDIMTAFNSLNSGVQNLALTRAMNDANQQIDQIRNSDMKEGQKYQETRALAENMTRRLTSMQIDPARITQVAGSISPSAPSSPEQAMLSGQPYFQQMGKQVDALEFGHKKELVNIAAGAKAQKDAQKSLEKVQEDFKKTYEKAQESVSAATALQGILATNNKLTGAAVMAKLPRVFGEKGKISDSERKLFAGSASAEDTLFQTLSTIGDSQMTPENKKQVGNLLQTVLDSSHKGLVDMGSLYTNKLSTNPAFSGYDPKRLAAIVTSGKLDPNLIVGQPNYLNGTGPTPGQYGGTAGATSPSAPANAPIPVPTASGSKYLINPVQPK